MKEYVRKIEALRPWLGEKLFLGLSLTEYVRVLLTPFNIAAGIILLIGLYFIVQRFSQGLVAVTGASDVQPWGLFLSWGLFTGVPLSATGFVLGSAVYLFGLKEYHPVVKNAILIGFLGYFFAVVFLLIDLGRPWRIFYPMLVAYGPASVMFLVAWHVALYLSCQALEFSPSAFHWLSFKTLRRWALHLTIGLTIFGVILSTLHQSALGAMFLLMPGKLHPLWYTPYIPWLFFISSIAAGLSMVIVVSALTQRFFRDQSDIHYQASLDNISLGLGKAASFVLLTYFALKLIAVAHGNHWDLLTTSWGYWFLIELLVFVLFPCFLFLLGDQRKSVGLIQFTALLTIIGVILNRLNVSLIAFNWNLPHRELFYWKEFIVVITIVTVEILVYRWIVNRMPVLREHPEYKVVRVRRGIEMKRYRGGELAPQGAYLNLSTWEVVQPHLYGEALILPGSGEVQYLKIPAPLVVIVGPLAGLAFIIFLPLMGIFGVAGLLAYKMGRGAQALGRRLVQTAAMGWRPGIAYLIRRGRTPEQEQPSEGAEGELAELEEKVKRLREQEKK